MTLAPELPGADVLIDRLLERGVAVSLGHSDATAAQANAAFDRGARSVTHIFNAMRPFLHRDPGIVGAALARPDVVVSIILDGIHLAPETARVVLNAAHGRVALVTDAITAAGVADGSYSFGNFDVHVQEGTVRGPDGVLAGSVLTMIEAVRNLHELGAPLEDAVAAATSTPARVLGDHDLGRLAIGLPADVVVLNDRVSFVIHASSRSTVNALSAYTPVLSLNSLSIEMRGIAHSAVAMRHRLRLPSSPRADDIPSATMRPVRPRRARCHLMVEPPDELTMRSKPRRSRRYLYCAL